MRNLDIEVIYELSPVQLGMLFHSVYAPQSGVYVAQLSLRLEGSLDLDAFEVAWRRVIARHGALRTSFHWEELDKPVQVVHRQAPFPLVRESWRGMSQEERTRRLEAFLSTERKRGFDLEKAPLLRLHLFEIEDQVHQLVWSFHHLCLDGWSFGLLFRELFGLYESQAEGTALELAPAPQYRAYIGWLQNQNLATAESFWRRQLQDLPPATQPEVGARLVGPVTTLRRYGELRCSLPPAVAARLEGLRRGRRLTLNTLMMGAWRCCFGVIATSGTWFSVAPSRAARRSCRESAPWLGSSSTPFRRGSGCPGGAIGRLVREPAKRSGRAASLRAQPLGPGAEVEWKTC